MKRKQKKTAPPKDSPATRKRRLQARIDEISEKSEQEMSNVMQTIEKVKAAFRSDKSS